MENSVLTGTRCFPMPASCVVPGSSWSQQGETKLAAPAVVGGLRIAVRSGRPVYRTRFCALVNSIGIALPTTDLMRMSVPEP